MPDFEMSHIWASWHVTNVISSSVCFFFCPQNPMMSFQVLLSFISILFQTYIFSFLYCVVCDQFCDQKYAWHC